jgi:acetolactate synthase I/II/III large subunit
MNGAEMILRTARKAGVEVCFANAGTTELPLVLAFETEPGIKPVLGLFEGVCTGAADGYGRMTGKPAMTLLHLGPGFANGVANLHNARRAHSPILNLIGDHTSDIVGLDPPLAMDIRALACTVSGWYRSCGAPGELSQNVAAAYGASLHGQIATLSVPSDYQQAQLENEDLASPQFAFDPLDKPSIERACRHMKSGQNVALILGGRALRQGGLQVAARIRAFSGCDLLTENLPAYMDRGAGLAEVARVPYFPEQAMELLSRYQAVVIAGTREPVSFFGYPGIRADLFSDDQPRILIADSGQDPVEALEYLAGLLNAPKDIDKKVLPELRHPRPAQGELTAERACRTLAACLPEGAILVDEGVSSAFSYYGLSRGLVPHSYITIAGGSIGYGMPCSTGAAMACPERPVINLEADGSAMYTVQALWTQARHNLNITTLICANRSYNILKMELERFNVGSFGPDVTSLVDIGDPTLNWVKIAEAMGVPAASVNTAEQLASEMGRSTLEAGPHLIEMVLS